MEFREVKEKLFSTQQAAAMLGFTPGRLRQLIMAGRAEPIMQIGGSWVFTADEIERLHIRVKNKGGRPKQK